MNESYSFRLEANKWVIKARWFYVLFITLVYSALNVSKILTIDWLSLTWLKSSAFLFLLLAIFANVLLYLISRMIDLERAHRHVSLLSFLQIIFEISLISLLMYELPDASLFVSALLFIPIVESIVLFGNIGPLLVAISTGVILNLLVILINFDFFPFLFGNNTENRLESLKNSTIFTWSLIFSAIYLVVGALSTYIAKKISQQEIKLEEEMANKEVQVKALKKFTKEMEKDARAIKAKDFELEMANKRLETLEEAKSKFVSVTAHQLRTPLSAIKWTFDMILTGRLGTINAEQKEFLNKGFASTERMIHIVNDLLHVDQMNTDKTELVFEQVDLNSLIDSVSFEFTNQATSKEIKLQIKKSAKSLPMIVGDQVKLRIVLENLLDNAVKYTLKGGEVILTASDAKLNTAEAVVEISIKDSGIGIPEVEKSKIFSKFFRATNAIRTEPDGSGIGLFIAKDIVEKHGGSLWYETSADNGSTFYLTLPVHRKSI